jgi:hypothetical protein
MANNGIFFSQDEVKMLQLSIENHGINTQRGSPVINYLDMFSLLNIELSLDQK